MSMQVLQTVLLVMGIAVGGTTCGFVIKNFCDTKKQTKAIEQNGDDIVALTAKVGKDHKDIMDKLDEDTKAILASDKKILDELKKQTPPKGGKAAPKRVNASQNDNESVQSENDQEDPVVTAVKDGLEKWANLRENNDKRFAEEHAQAQARLDKLEQKNAEDLDAVSNEIAANVRKAMGPDGGEQ